MKTRMVKGVWNASEHGAEQAAILRLRSGLLIALRGRAEAWDIAQA